MAEDNAYKLLIMQLDGLHLALKNGGAYFEAIVLDACMMANLETACAIKDYAAWMVASEEIVPGKGTAVKSWLQELYNHPAQNKAAGPEHLRYDADPIREHG